MDTKDAGFKGKVKPMTVTEALTSVTGSTTNIPNMTGIGPDVTGGLTATWPQPAPITTIDQQNLIDEYMETIYQNYMDPSKITVPNHKYPLPASTGPKMVTRLSIPVMPGNGNAGRGRLEMTCDSLTDRIELTLIMDGKSAIELNVSKKDLEALLGQLTLEKLAK